MVLAGPETKPKLKQKLTTVADILTFAEKELHLPAEGQYERYTDLGRRHAVWVVFAAPEFSVEPKTWSYPLGLAGYLTELAGDAEAVAPLYAAEKYADVDHADFAPGEGSGYPVYYLAGLLQTAR